MNNKLAYLDDTYCFQLESAVTKVGTDADGPFLTVGETIFYPQGGGQPWDTGTVQWRNEDVPVNAVRYVEGEARIYGPFDKVGISVGDLAKQKVNRDTRLMHAKAHTAGHLLANVVENLNVGLTAIKGYHFPGGSYVEFSGPMPQSPDDFAMEVDRLIGEAVAIAVPVVARCVMLDELKKVCPTVPPGLPSDKPLRIVQIGSFSPLPCGGTHVRHLDELGAVAVTKVKRKNPNVRISYTSV